MADRTCSIEGCAAKPHARGMCNKHYLRVWTKGCFPQKTAEDRFWEKVDKHGKGGCWLWTASDNGNDYGQFFIGTGRLMSAHRYSYELATRRPIGDFDLDHTCHVPRCVNPEHLRVATRKQNMEHRLGAQSNSETGIRGVRWRDGAWEARARHNGRDIPGGRFATKEEASEAARLLRNELFTHNDRDRAVGSAS